MHLKRQHGIDVPEEARLDPKKIGNSAAVLAVNSLFRSHPPDPVFKIAVLDQIAAFSLAGLDVKFYVFHVFPDLVNSVNAIINQKIEQATKGAPKVYN